MSGRRRTTRQTRPKSRSGKWRHLGKIPNLRSVRRAANLGEVPDDPEFLSAVAGVLLQITADQALEALAAGPARGGRSGIFRRRG